MDKNRAFQYKKKKKLDLLAHLKTDSFQGGGRAPEAGWLQTVQKNQYRASLIQLAALASVVVWRTQHRPTAHEHHHLCGQQKMLLCLPHQMDSGCGPWVSKTSHVIICPDSDKIPNTRPALVGTLPPPISPTTSSSYHSSILLGA